MSTRPSRRTVVMINSLGIGGAQIQLAHLVRALVAADWPTHVYSLIPSPDPAPVHRDVVATGTPVHVLSDDGASAAGLTSQAVRLLREHRPDVLVTFLFQANVLGRVAGQLAGVPAIVSSIRNERFGGRWRDIAVRVTDPLATVTTANSLRAAQALTDRRVVRADRMVVIPNAVASPVRTAASHRRARASHGVEEDEFLWLAVGRMTPQKDYETLLTAFTRLTMQRPRTRLWIAGDGPQRRRMERLAADLGIRSRVSFLGFRTDVDELLHAADGFVLSSRWEGSPNVVLEAMSTGVPVVATDVGGVSELLGASGTGVRVPCAAPDALALGMFQVTDLPAIERQRMADAARRVATDQHGLETVTTRWLDVLEAACRVAGHGHDRARSPLGSPPAVRSSR